MAPDATPAGTAGFLRPGSRLLVVTDGQPERCRSSSDEAFGIGERYRDAVSQMGDRGFIGSICSDDYGMTLRRIAELVASPQVLDLPQSARR